MSFNVAANLKAMRKQYAGTLNDCRVRPSCADALQAVFSLRDPRVAGKSRYIATHRYVVKGNKSTHPLWDTIAQHVEQETKTAKLAVPMFVAFPGHKGERYGFKEMAGEVDWTDTLGNLKGRVTRMTLGVGMHGNDVTDKPAQVATHVEYLLLHDKRDAMMFKLACL